MTPYPRRDRSNSKDKSSAPQGNETFRRFHGYLGTGPWKILVEGEVAPDPESEDDPGPEPESTPKPEPESQPKTETESEVEPEFAAGPESECVPEPESTAGAAEGSAPYIPMPLGHTDDTTPTADPEEKHSGEKDLEDDVRAKLKEEELILDEPVEKMMNMEIYQRKDKGDMEGFERGLKYCLEFNIWKTEREWKLQKMHEAKSTLAPADNENKTELKLKLGSRAMKSTKTESSQ